MRRYKKIGKIPIPIATYYSPHKKERLSNTKVQQPQYLRSCITKVAILLYTEKSYTKTLHRSTLQLLANRWVGDRDKKLSTLSERLITKVYYTASLTATAPCTALTAC